MTLVWTLRLYYSPNGLCVRVIYYYSRSAAKAASTKMLRLLGHDFFHTSIQAENT
jgi:hypothetical protein